jgi:hypothetical protein
MKRKVVGGREEEHVRLCLYTLIRQTAPRPLRRLSSPPSPPNTTEATTIASSSARTVRLQSAAFPRPHIPPKAHPSLISPSHSTHPTSSAFSYSVRSAHNTSRSGGSTSPLPLFNPMSPSLVPPVLSPTTTSLLSSLASRLPSLSLCAPVLLFIPPSRPLSPIHSSKLSSHDIPR